MDPLVPLARALNLRGVRYVLIGVAGVNLWAHSAGVVFSTHDKALFLPLDPDNCLSAWEACDALGFSLWSGAEPLDRPRDRSLAEAVVARRATIRASDVEGALQADLSFVMGTFAFDTVWQAYLPRGRCRPPGRQADAHRRVEGADRAREGPVVPCHSRGRAEAVAARTR